MSLRSIGIGLALLLASEGATAQMPDVFADDDIWLIDEPDPAPLENARTHPATIREDPDPGDRDSIAPVQTLEPTGSRDCREYEKTVTIGGRPQRAHGTVCRRPDGAWEIVGSEQATAPAPVREHFEPAPPLR